MNTQVPIFLNPESALIGHCRPYTSCFSNHTIILNPNPVSIAPPLKSSPPTQFAARCDRSTNTASWIPDSPSPSHAAASATTAAVAATPAATATAAAAISTTFKPATSPTCAESVGQPSASSSCSTSDTSTSASDPTRTSECGDATFGRQIHEYMHPSRPHVALNTVHVPFDILDMALNTL